MFPAPEIRLPPEVRRGDVIPVYVKFRHPVRTGLEKVAGRFVQAAEPYFIRVMEARYLGSVVCRYDMTPALADNPLVSFKLRAVEEGLVSVAAWDSRGVRTEAAVALRFAGG
ncbi:MAG TPA: thiosulfate oxidation carrier complex protein SoxZ [Thermodesulfobacteriota bacterium]